MTGLALLFTILSFTLFDTIQTSACSPSSYELKNENSTFNSYDHFNVGDSSSFTGPSFVMLSLAFGIFIGLNQGLNFFDNQHVNG